MISRAVVVALAFAEPVVPVLEGPVGVFAVVAVAPAVGDFLARSVAAAAVAASAAAASVVATWAAWAVASSRRSTLTDETDGGTKTTIVEEAGSPV